MPIMATEKSQKKFANQTLQQILRSKDESALTEWFAHTPSRRERDQQVEALDDDSVNTLYQNFGTVLFGRLLSEITPGVAAETLKTLDTPDRAAVLVQVGVSETADMLRELGKADTRTLMHCLPEELRNGVGALLRWDTEQAGANMTPSFLSVSEQLTVTEAIDVLRGPARDTEVTSYIYLLDGEGRLNGTVSFRELLTADPESRLWRLSRNEVRQVDPATDQEEAAKLLRDLGLAALPVTQEGKILGVLTSERAATILDVETTEDFQRLASTQGQGLSLRDASLWLLYRSRVTWLVVLVFGNIFSGAGIAYFEDLIESVVALVFFLPLLIDSGGNAGSQAATLMVRGLATGQVMLRDWGKMLGKEAAVASLLGGTMALAVSLVGVVRGGPEIALVVALTMVLVVLIGSVVGMSLPFMLSKLRLDPASASAPLITSVCDAVGVVVYFSIASVILL